MLAGVSVSRSPNIAGGRAPEAGVVFVTLPEPLPNIVGARSPSREGLIYHPSPLATYGSEPTVHRGEGEGEGETGGPTGPIAQEAGPPTHPRASGADGGLRELNLQSIREAIERATAYPLYARQRRLEGRVLAEFSVDSDGMPKGIKILINSGHRSLDAEAIRAIRRAGPYPPFSGRVEVPITFRLTEGQ